APLIDYRSTQAAMQFEAEDMFWSRRTLWQMILGGVLERHPGLQVGFLEMYTDWVPRTIEHLDYLIANAKGRISQWEQVCHRLASEYFRRQCFDGPWAIWTKEEIDARTEIGVDNFVYGPDFPHGPCPWYHVNEFFRSTLGVAGVDEDDARAMLGEN